MKRKSKQRIVSPAAIVEDLLIGAWKTQALVAALSLDVFSHIAEGKRTVKAVAAAAGASQRGIANLLDALVGMNYLRKSDDRYALLPLSSTYLVRGKKMYMGASAQPVALNWDTWGHLTESVKTGRPYTSVNKAEKGREFFPKLVAGIFPSNFAASTVAVSHFSAKEKGRIHKILDVAAGSGAWSLAFAQAIPEARVTTVDFPEMTPITREFAEKLGVLQRYDYRAGDMRQVDFGRDAYDLVILGHIIHSEGEAHGKNLLRKSYEALRSGGKLLIADYVPNDARSGPVMPVLFGLNMLLHSDEGNVFTMRDYRAWLKAAGFRDVATIPIPPPATLIVATK